MFPDFVPFPKIPRFSRECVITEKIDGTNASIFITEDGKELRAGSRNRWITPENDNAGFAKWVQQHKEELLTLGPGHHFGEWWGVGIQRGYDLSERRFSLFNVSRWNENRPSCCHVVPELYRGDFTEGVVNAAITLLKVGGSIAAPNYMDPEGIVIYHVAGNYLFKKTVKDDEKPKGIVNVS